MTAAPHADTAAQIATDKNAAYEKLKALVFAAEEISLNDRALIVAAAIEYGSACEIAAIMDLHARHMASLDRIAGQKVA